LRVSLFLECFQNKRASKNMRQSKTKPHRKKIIDLAPMARDVDDWNLTGKVILEIK
jgi:hypothetical protein